MEGRKGTPQASPRHTELGITLHLAPPQLKATDADEGEFGRVWYRILHGEWAAWWGELGLPPFSELPGV